MRWFWCLLLTSACGPLSPLRSDAGVNDAGVGGGFTSTGGGFTSTGGGFVSTGGGTTATGGGTTATGGGTTATGGGFVSTGGGTTATGGGTTATGGGTTTTGGGTTATGGGTMTGGGTTATGGGTAATGGGEGSADGGFTFSRAAITNTGSVYGHFKGIAGRPNDVYALSGDNRLFHSTGAAFTEIALGKPYTANGLAVTSDGAVLLAELGFAGSCTANCTQASSYTFQALSAGESLYGVCGSTAVGALAVGESGSGAGIAYRFDGSGWTRVSQNLGIKSARACAVADSGVMFISGQNNLVRFDGSSFTVELADLGTISELSQMWFSVAAAGPNLFAAGGRWRILKRAGTQWQFSYQPNGINNFYALAAISSNEVYATGASETSEALWVRWAGSSWEKTGASVGLEVVFSVWVESANRVWLAGAAPGGQLAIVLASR